MIKFRESHEFVNRGESLTYIYTLFFAPQCLLRPERRQHQFGLYRSANVGRISL